MMFKTVTALALASCAISSPIFMKREVPQEHSHDVILNAVESIIQRGGDPIKSVNVVFGVLGQAAGTFFHF